MTTDSGKAVALPADTLSAIYDHETKFLYLYASGKYPQPALTAFKRETWLGGLKFTFEGYYPDDVKPETAGVNNYAQKLAFDFGQPGFNKDSVLIVVAGEHEGTENQTKKVPIVVVPVFQ
jgi:hypothetical protein